MLDLQLFNNDIRSVIFSKIDIFCNCAYYDENDDFYFNGDYIYFNIPLFHPILLNNIIKKNDINILRFFLIRMKLLNNNIIKLIFNFSYKNGNFKIMEWMKYFIINNNLKFNKYDYNCRWFNFYRINKNIVRCYDIAINLKNNENLYINIHKNINIQNSIKNKNSIIKLNYYDNEQEYINKNNICSFCFNRFDNIIKYEDDNLIICYCNNCKNKIKNQVKYNDSLLIKYIGKKETYKIKF